MTTKKAFTPVDAGAVVEDAAIFFINNQVYEGFKNISIQKDITSLSRSYSITLIDKWRVEREDYSIKPGMAIQCKLAKKDAFNGFIDKFSITFSATQRNLTLSGRDKTADLVDCSIIGKNEFNNLTIDAIAREIISKKENFNLDVIVKDDVGEPFVKVTVNQGESPFELLERLAKQRDLLLTTSTSGDLVIEKRASFRSTTELVEGVNIKSAAVTFDNSERFSEYIVKSQNPSLLGNTDDNSKAAGKSTDKGIDRYRPLLVISENPGKADEAQKRSQWEASYRSAKGMEVKVSVNGWLQKDGTLYDTNQLIHLDCRSIGIKSDLLVKSVRQTLSASDGKLTELTLIRKDAFTFLPEIAKSDDPIENLGW